MGLRVLQTSVAQITDGGHNYQGSGSKVYENNANDAEVMTLSFQICNQPSKLKLSGYCTECTVIPPKAIKLICKCLEAVQPFIKHF